MANNKSLPIKDLQDLRNFKEAIRMGRNGARNIVMVEIGLATGLRIGDILKLRKKDIYNGFIRIKTQKNHEKKEWRNIELNNRVRAIVEGYCATLNDEDELFDIKYVQAWKVIKKAADLCGLDNISTHSLRKTAAWHFYHNTGKDINLTKGFLDHETTDDTIKYLDLTMDEINEVLVKNDVN